MNNLRSSNINNPVRFFEQLYCSKGLEFLEHEFDLRTIGNSPHDYYDKDDDVFIHYIEHPVTGEVYQTEFSYRIYCKSLLSQQRRETLQFMQDRIDSTNSPNERSDVLNRILKKLKSCYDFVNKSGLVESELHLNFIYNLESFIRKKYINETIMLKSDASITPQIPQRILVASNEDYVQTLKAFGIIRASKEDISKINYYFKLSKPRNPPKEKIQWLKSEQLFRFFVKYALKIKAKGKHSIAAAVFQVGEYTEKEIVKWNSQEVGKIPPDEHRLRKVLKKLGSDNKKK